jgi:hypothetical protein
MLVFRLIFRRDGIDGRDSCRPSAGRKVRVVDDPGMSFPSIDGHLQGAKPGTRARSFPAVVQHAAPHTSTRQLPFNSPHSHRERNGPSFDSGRSPRASARSRSARTIPLPAADRRPRSKGPVRPARKPHRPIRRHAVDSPIPPHVGHRHPRAHRMHRPVDHRSQAIVAVARHAAHDARRPPPTPRCICATRNGSVDFIGRDVQIRQFAIVVRTPSRVKQNLQRLYPRNLIK